MRRLPFRLHVTVSLAFVLATACSGGKSPEGTPVPAAQASKACPNEIPFRAGYLPAGFGQTLQEGPAPRLPTLKNVTIFHYSGSGGRYIEILRGGKRATLDGSTPIRVLNLFGRIGPIP